MVLWTIGTVAWGWEFGTVEREALVNDLVGLLEERGGWPLLQQMDLSRYCPAVEITDPEDCAAHHAGFAEGLAPLIFSGPIGGTHVIDVQDRGEELEVSVGMLRGLDEFVVVLTIVGREDPRWVDLTVVEGAQSLVSAARSTTRMLEGDAVFIELDAVLNAILLGEDPAAYERLKALQEQVDMDLTWALSVGASNFGDVEALDALATATPASERDFPTAFNLWSGYLTAQAFDMAVEVIDQLPEAVRATDTVQQVDVFHVALQQGLPAAYAVLDQRIATASRPELAYKRAVAAALALGDDAQVLAYAAQGEEAGALLIGNDLSWAVQDPELAATFRRERRVAQGLPAEPPTPPDVPPVLFTPELAYRESGPQIRHGMGFLLQRGKKVVAVHPRMGVDPVGLPEPTSATLKLSEGQASARKLQHFRPLVQSSLGDLAGLMVWRKVKGVAEGLALSPGSIGPGAEVWVVGPDGPLLARVVSVELGLLNLVPASKVDVAFAFVGAPVVDEEGRVVAILLGGMDDAMGTLLTGIHADLVRPIVE